MEGEIEDEDSTSTVAVKILSQNASLEDKARFLDEAKMYRDVAHENILTFVEKCLQEDPWILIFELCSMVSMMTNRKKNILRYSIICIQNQRSLKHTERDMIDNTHEASQNPLSTKKTSHVTFSQLCCLLRQKTHWLVFLFNTKL